MNNVVGMGDKSSINVENSINSLETALSDLERIRKFDIDDLDVADRTRRNLWEVISPVMKAFLNTGLKNDAQVRDLLLKAVTWETELAELHSSLVENRR